MSQVERISVEDAPSPKGAYSQVVRAVDFLYVSGEGPIVPVSQEFIFSEIRGETKLTLENVERVLAGSARVERISSGAASSSPTPRTLMRFGGTGG